MKKECQWFKKTIIFLILGMIPYFGVMGYTAPTAADVGYDFWDFMVNDLAKGPIGQLGAGGAVLSGLAVAAKTNTFVWPGIVAALGIVVFKLDTITQSFGMVI